jgi:hypothetical protein
MGKRRRVTVAPHGIMPMLARRDELQPKPQKIVRAERPQTPTGQNYIEALQRIRERLNGGRP